MGVLKKQSTLTIAVWASILIHTVGFLGFELAFSDKRESFPKSEPRTVTVVSIDSVRKPVLPSLNNEHRKKITAPDIEMTVLEESVLVPEDSLETGIAPNSSIKELNLVNNNTNNTEAYSHLVEDGVTREIMTNIEKPTISEPVPVSEIVPVYSFRARKKGYEGTVTMDVIVSSQGVPVFCSVSNSSGFKDLDKAARETVMASSFYPGKVNGEATESTLRIHIKFELNQS